MLNDAERISSKDIKRRLKDEPYFRDLMSVETHGEPGDVYFVDLRVLHTPAPNSTPIRRIMLTRRFFLESQREAIYGGGKSEPMS